MALDLSRAWPVIQEQALVFRPQVWWLDAVRDDLFIGRTETMVQDFAMLCYIAGLKPQELAVKNRTRQASKLSVGASAIVRSRYIEDYEWWLC